MADWELGEGGCTCGPASLVRGQHGASVTALELEVTSAHLSTMPEYGLPPKRQNQACW